MFSDSGLYNLSLVIACCVGGFGLRWWRFGCGGCCCGLLWFSFVLLSMLMLCVLTCKCCFGCLLLVAVVLLISGFDVDAILGFLVLVLDLA